MAHPHIGTMFQAFVQVQVAPTPWLLQNLIARSKQQRGCLVPLRTVASAQPWGIWWQTQSSQKIWRESLAKWKWQILLPRVCARELLMVCSASGRQDFKRKMAMKSFPQCLGPNPWHIEFPTASPPTEWRNTGGGFTWMSVHHQVDLWKIRPSWKTCPSGWRQSSQLHLQWMVMTRDSPSCNNSLSPPLKPFTVLAVRVNLRWQHRQDHRTAKSLASSLHVVRCENSPLAPFLFLPAHPHTWHATSQSTWRRLLNELKDPKVVELVSYFKPWARLSCAVMLCF